MACTEAVPVLTDVPRSILITTQSMESQVPLQSESVCFKPFNSASATCLNILHSVSLARKLGPPAPSQPRLRRSCSGRVRVGFGQLPQLAPCTAIRTSHPIAFPRLPTLLLRSRLGVLLTVAQARFKDDLRSHYQQLSAEPNSLANLDQGTHHFWALYTSRC